MAKMKTPTLEEVKEYFKDAKEVACLCNGESYDISENITRDFYEWNNGFWIDTQIDIKVWDETHGYAKILSYKEPKEKTYKITREQILKYNMKYEFPEVFETKPEVGKWYWRYNKKELAVWNSGKDTYGFNGSFQFLKHYSFTDIDSDPTEATNQEVEEALTKEAVRLKYKDNLKYVECLCGFNKEASQEYYNDNKSIFYYEKHVNKLWIIDGSFLDICIFDSGQWAEIIPTLTIQEAEEKLNCKII